MRRGEEVDFTTWQAKNVAEWQHDCGFRCYPGWQLLCVCVKIVISVSLPVFLLFMSGIMHMGASVCLCVFLPVVRLVQTNLPLFFLTHFSDACLSKGVKNTSCVWPQLWNIQKKRQLAESTFAFSTISLICCIFLTPLRRYPRPRSLSFSWLCFDSMRLPQATKTPL